MSDRAARRAVLLIALGAMVASWLAIVQAAAGVASAASLPRSCPVASMIASAAGAALTRDESEGALGYIVCGYANAETGAQVVFNVGPVKQITITAWLKLMDRQAALAKSPLEVLKGLGEAAVEFTKHDARANPDHIADTDVLVLVGVRQLSLVASLPARRVVAVARALVG